MRNRGNEVEAIMFFITLITLGLALLYVGNKFKLLLFNRLGFFILATVLFALSLVLVILVLPGILKESS